MSTSSSETDDRSPQQVAPGDDDWSVPRGASSDEEPSDSNRESDDDSSVPSSLGIPWSSSRKPNNPNRVFYFHDNLRSIVSPAGRRLPEDYGYYADEDNGGAGYHEYVLDKDIGTLIQDGWTWTSLITELGRSPPWTTSYCLGTFLWLSNDIFLYMGGIISEPTYNAYGDYHLLLTIATSDRARDYAPEADVFVRRGVDATNAIGNLLKLASASKCPMIRLGIWDNEKAPDTTKFPVPATLLTEFLEGYQDLFRLDIFREGDEHYVLDADQAFAIAKSIGPNTQFTMATGVADSDDVAERQVRCHQAIKRHRPRVRAIAVERALCRGSLLGLALSKLGNNLDLIYVTLQGNADLIRSPTAAITGTKRKRNNHDDAA